MATGKRAFPGESPVTIIGAILHKEPKAIRELNPQVPEELQRIVVKTLEKDREDRYQTAHELMVDLRRLMKKETERSQSGLAAEPLKQEESRKWIWIGAAAVLCAIAWVALAGRGTPADPAPLPMEQLTFSSETKSPPIFTDGSRIYFVSGHNPVEMSVKGGATAPLRAAIGTMSILDISPDGSEFLLLQSDLNDETQRGTIWTMPVLGGAAKRLGNITARGASYSPDGKLIAFNEKQSVYVCDAEGQNVKEIWNTHHMVPGNPAFSPDSKKIRVTVSRSILEDDLTRIWELNVDGSDLHLLPLPEDWPQDSGAYYGIWTPGGKHFVFGALQRWIQQSLRILRAQVVRVLAQAVRRAIDARPTRGERHVAKPGWQRICSSLRAWRKDRCISTTKRKSDFCRIWGDCPRRRSWSHRTGNGWYTRIIREDICGAARSTAAKSCN